MIITANVAAGPVAGEWRGNRRRWVFLTATALGVLCMWAELGQYFAGEPNGAGSEKRQSLEDFVRLHRPGFMKGTQARYGTVFVVDPVDLGCPPCFEDFEQLLGKLTLLAGPDASRRILLLIRQGDDGPWGDSAAVRRWAEIQGFSVPLLMVPDTIYRTFGYRKTGVLVVDGSFQAVLAKEMPMEPQAHATIRTRMEESERGENP